MKSFFLFILGFLTSLSLPQKVNDFLMWPIATKLLGRNFQSKILLLDGFYMYGSMDDILSRNILILGPRKKHLWEPSTSILLEKLSVVAKEIIIAGSHIGYLVLKAAKVTGGTVHAFEPIPELFKHSQDNFHLNSELEKKIVLNAFALGETEGEIELYSEGIRSSAIPYSGGHTQHQNIVTVPMTTLDGYTNRKVIEKVDLILLDIEGFELLVLRGAERVLQGKPDLIIEVSPRVLSHSTITPQMVEDFLSSKDYAQYFIDDYAKEFSIIPVDIDSKKIFLKRDYVNVYATKSLNNFI